MGPNSSGDYDVVRTLLPACRDQEAVVRAEAILALPALDHHLEIIEVLEENALHNDSAVRLEVAHQVAPRGRSNLSGLLEIGLQLIGDHDAEVAATAAESLSYHYRTAEGNDLDALQKLSPYAAEVTVRRASSYQAYHLKFPQQMMRLHVVILESLDGAQSNGQIVRGDETIAGWYGVKEAGEAHWVDVVEAALSDNDPLIRANAASSIEESMREHSRFASICALALSDPDWRVRDAAMWGLSELDIPFALDASAANRVLSDLKDHSSAIKWAAAAAASSIKTGTKDLDDEIRNALVEALKDEDERIRDQARESLGWRISSKIESDVEWAQSTLASPDDPACLDAVAAVCSIQSGEAEYLDLVERAFRAIRSRMSSDPSGLFHGPLTRRLIFSFLRYLINSDQKLSEATSLLMYLLRSEHSGVACDPIADGRGDVDLGLLITGLQSAEWAIREACTATFMKKVEKQDRERDFAVLKRSRWR